MYLAMKDGEPMQHTDNLTPEFFHALVQMIGKCQEHGVNVVPYEGIRTPHEQAKLWRRGRSLAFIEQKIKWLADNGMEYLSAILEDVGPQEGRLVTHALPGFSWHQWGEACDLYVADDEGNPIWDGGNDGYFILAECAEEEGLTSGHRWAMRDSVHVQFRAESVRAVYKPEEIDQHMRLRFNL